MLPPSPRARDRLEARWPALRREEVEDQLEGSLDHQAICFPAWKRDGIASRMALRLSPTC
jgi:hypothetical protein